MNNDIPKETGQRVERDKVVSILWAKAEVADCCGHRSRRDAFREAMGIMEKLPSA